MAITISNAAAKVVNLAGGIVAEGYDVAGGYFVIDALANIPSYANQVGQLCFCTGDSKLYQYTNEGTWAEFKLKASTLDNDLDFATNEAVEAAVEANTTAIADLRSQAIASISNKGSEITYTKADGSPGGSFNTTFIGTREAYKAAYDAGNIPIGTIVIITDESDDEDTETENAGASSSILGTGVLGYLILG